MVTVNGENRNGCSSLIFGVVSVGVEIEPTEAPATDDGRPDAAAKALSLIVLGAFSENGLTSSIRTFFGIVMTNSPSTGLV
jgi:hypothetical protein